MADILNDDSKKRKFKIRSTRVDLTPMVDLGFLLITFFVFTTSLTDKKVVELMVPDNSDTVTFDPLAQSNVITLNLGPRNTINYFEGSDSLNLQPSNYSSSGIRNVLLKKKAKIIGATGKNKMIVIIKPSDSSTMKNLVSVMDEMEICEVMRYYID